MKATSLLVVLASLISTACTLTPLSVTLKPKVEIPATNLVQSRNVGLTVVDDRPRSIVGYRNVGTSGATITTVGDPPSAVRTALADGLSRHGFTVVTAPAPDGRELRAEIRGLDYTISQAIFGATQRVESTLKGICVTGNSRSFEGTYRGESEERVQVAQTDAAIEDALNRALSQSIQRLLQDTQLIQCLARQ